jgi:hypothetical protein
MCHGFLSALQSKMDSFLLALFVLVAPAACYLAIHATVMYSWMHFWSVIILGSAPLLYICAIPQGLWWVPMPPRLITGLSRLLMVLAAFGLLAGESWVQRGKPCMGMPSTQPGARQILASA